MQQLGKYNVIRRLGVGGMAEVFLCKLTGIGGFEKHVVLKKIRADIATDDEFITMFFDEARLAANLSHPNIIQVFEVDQLDGTPYIAMEYVRGATLATVLQKLRAAQRRMDFGHAAYVFAGVCGGLDHAHNAADASGRLLRIVHRDISPQNIIVSSDGTPKIFDFGVAKARGSLSLTGVDQVKGKFGYMAPEQLRAQPVDSKADVFAVGVCMYEAITGKRPFTGGTEAELYAARHAGRFRMPSELVPEIPVELEHMILSAMAPDPSDRPTAVELQAELATFSGTGTKHASSAHAITPWLKDLLGEEMEAYESYASSNPSMTPLPRSANLPPTKHAVEARNHRRPNTNSLIVGLGLAAIVLTAVLALIVVKKRAEPTVAASAPPREVAEPSPEQDAAIRVFLDEAQKYLADKKLGLAADLLEKASQLESRDAALAIRRTELRHQLEIERGRVLAHDAISARDWTRAIELSNQLLVRDPNDTDAMKLLTEARRGQDTQLPAVAVAVAVPTEHTVAVESRKPAPPPAPVAKKKVAVTKNESKSEVTKSAAGSGAGSATKLAAGSGAGSATKAAGSAAMPPPAPAAGSGSAHVAAQVAPPPAPTAAPPPKPAIMATPVAPARTAGPGSLDAMPSFAKVSVDGSLTTTEVQNALTRSLDTLRSCYRAAAKKANQTPDVSIKVSFEIDEGARASSVRILGGDSFGLGSCARQAISDVRTRVAPDVGTVSVSAVVRFKPTR